MHEKTHKLVTFAETPQPEILVVAASARRRGILVDLIRRSSRYRQAHVTSASLTQLSSAQITVAELETQASADCFLRHAENAPNFAGFVALIDGPPATWLRREIHAGVNAILGCDVNSEELEFAIEVAEQGLVLLPTEFAQTLATVAAHTLEFSDLVEHLTVREREVLELMGSGLSNKEIATRLGISEHTAKFHTSSVLGKLGAGSRTEAVSRGIRGGLI